MVRVGSAVVGAISCLLMIVAALGPWIETPIGSFSAVAGLGWPVIVGALLALIVQLGTAAGAVRWSSLWATAIGLLGLVLWAIVSLAVRLAGHSTGLLAAIVGDRVRGARHLSAVGSIETGWGLRLLGLASFVLVLSSCAAAIFGATRSAASASPARGTFRRSAREQVGGRDAVPAAPQGFAGQSDDLL